MFVLYFKKRLFIVEKEDIPLGTDDIYLTDIFGKYYTAYVFVYKERSG